MSKISKKNSNQIFNREHLIVIIGTSLLALHVVDDNARLGDAFPPPFIPLLLATAIYSFLPLTIRALIIMIFGIIFSIAQIFGHITPLLERPLGGSDLSGMVGLVGALILVALTVKLLKERYITKKS